MKHRPFRLVFAFFLTLALFAGIVPAVSAAPPAQAQLAIPLLVVNTSFLNVRSGDGPQYTVIATVVGGTELQALASNSDQSWFLVATPIGNGWVDVSFTLPRGDFRFVPVIAVQQPAAPVYSAPLSIGLIQTNTGTTVAAAPAATTTTSRQFATLRVLAVNLRTQPGDTAAVLTTLYSNTNPEYQVVGRTFDSRFVEWAAIVVANFGTGWVEAAKLSFTTRTVTVTATPTAGSSTSSGTLGLPVPELSAPYILVNTSFQNIRTGPGAQYSVILNVPGGTTFNPLGITPDLTWYLVGGDFGFGWISSEFVLFRGDFRNVPILRDLY